MATNASNDMTNLLSRFGVDYKNAPAPTPALLAFMRGLGLSLDTAADTKERTVSRAKERAATARSDIDRADVRTRQNMLADLVRRGVLRSGEANTRYGQQAENVSRSKGEVERSLAQSIESADLGFQSTRDNLRQRALETTLTTETNEATRKAALDAEKRAWERQDQAAEKAYQRTKEAQDRLYEQQERLLRGG